MKIAPTKSAIALALLLGSLAGFLPLVAQAQTQVPTPFVTTIPEPGDMVFDRGGNLYVIGQLEGARGEEGPGGEDVGQLYKVTPNGVPSLIRTTPVQFTAIAIDQADNLYLVDNDNNLIRRTPTGSETVLAPPTGGPRAMDFDSTLNLYYSNGGQAVRKYVIGGSDTVLATERAPGQPFNQLLHLTVAPAGDVYVSDLSGPVYRITPGGSVSAFVTVSANGMTPDSGWLAFDSVGTLFVAGVFQGGIFKVLPDGSQSLFVSTQDAPNVRGLAFSPSGDLYIADNDANTITRVIGAGPSTVAPAAVPTLSEWAMILFGLVLAGGAMLMVQRRRTLA